MTIIRFLNIIIALSFLMGFSACDSEERQPERLQEAPEETDSPVVNLKFSVVALSGANPDDTRAEPSTTTDENNYFENATNKYELIHNLRVIIIRENGIVEQNRMVTIENGAVRYDNLEFPVHSAEKKKIYLLANSDGIDYDFDRLKPGVMYSSPFIEDIILETSSNLTVVDNADSSLPKRYVPMSEVHEVTIQGPDELKGNSDVEIGPLFVTRATVKFSFLVSAEYGNGIYLSEITVNKLADKEFFLPKETVYVPSKGEPPMQNWSSAADPDIFGRFIKNYSTPASASYYSVTFTPESPIELGTGQSKSCNPHLYFCESLYFPTNDEDSPNNTPYSVQISVMEKDSKGNFMTPYTFDPVSLPNLPLLPRNTHVKIKIKLGKGPVNCEVQVVPYVGVNLNPQFGLDRDKTTS